MKIHGAKNLNLIQDKLRQIDPSIISNLDDKSYNMFL